MKSIIKNGMVVVGNQVSKLDLRIEEGTIAELGTNMPTDGYDVYDATDCIVLPGGVDVSTRLAIGPDGKKSAAAFRQGSIAAAFGGTTTIVEKPVVAVNDAQKVLEEYTQLAKESFVNYSFHQACQGKPSDEFIKECTNLGLDGFPSVFAQLAYEKRVSDEDLLRLMREISLRGIYLAVEADSHAPLSLMMELHLKKGRTIPYALPSSHPSWTEGEAALRIANLVRAGSLSVLAMNVSSKEALDAYSAAQITGLPCLVSTDTHYLFLDLELYRDAKHNPYNFITYPPLRSKEDNEYLTQAVFKDLINIVASDHCACSAKSKEACGNAFEAIGGLPGVELRMPILFSELVLKRNMPLTRFAEITSTHVTRMMGLRDKGRIEGGVDADIVVIDPNDERTIRVQDLHEGCDYTPYEGMVVRGFPRYTFVGGNLVVDKGELKANNPSGQLTFRKAVAAR